MLKTFRKFLKNDDAATAVEFGLLGLPFFMLLMGIVEVSLFFASGVVLEGASAQAARQILTGQAQASANPQQDFQDALCANVSVMLTCANIVYESIVVTSGTFGGASSYQPVYDKNGDLVPQGFAAGNENNVILIRSYYHYNFLTPFIGNMLTGSMTKNWMPLLSTVVIKAEPYKVD